jgi:hypothetical protein
MAPVNQGAIKNVYHCIEPSQAPASEQARATARARAVSPESAERPLCRDQLDYSAQSVHKGLYERLGKLGKGHKRSLQMGRYLHKKDSRRAWKLQNCAAWLAFRHYYTTNEPMKLSAGMFCSQHLLCPVCARLRAGRTAKKYLERVEIVHQEHTKARLSMVTLTVKDGPNLRERYTHLMKAFGVLLDKARKARSGGRNVTEWNKVIGGVASVEVKKGKGSGLWHPHIHALISHDQWIDLKALKSEWEEMTKDSHQVDIKNLEASKSGRYDRESLQLQRDFVEVFKYANKFSEMSIEDNWSAFGVLSGKRLLRPWGAYWGVEVPEELTDDLLEDLPFIERFFTYSMGAYVERSRSQLVKCVHTDHIQRASS